LAAVLLLAEVLLLGSRCPALPPPGVHQVPPLIRLRFVPPPSLISGRPRENPAINRAAQAHWQLESSLQ